MTNCAIFNTSDKRSVKNMFNGCSSLTSITLIFDIGLQYYDMSGLIDDCDKLT